MNEKYLSQEEAGTMELGLSDLDYEHDSTTYRIMKDMKVNNDRHYKYVIIKTIGGQLVDTMYFTENLEDAYKEMLKLEDLTKNMEWYAVDSKKYTKLYELAQDNQKERIFKLVLRQMDLYADLTYKAMNMIGSDK